MLWCSEWLDCKLNFIEDWGELHIYLNIDNGYFEAYNDNQELIVKEPTHELLNIEIQKYYAKKYD